MNDNKVKDALDKATGKVKEGVGRVTGNDSLESEGQRDQAKAHASEAVDKVKESFTDR